MVNHHLINYLHLNYLMGYQIKLNYHQQIKQINKNSLLF